MHFFTVFSLAQEGIDSLLIRTLDEVILTPTKLRDDKFERGKTLTEINAEDIEMMQGQSLAQLINQVVGIEINGSRGNPGQNLSYYARGGKNRQVLILFDEVPISDASQIANDFDLRLVNTQMIERIDILKGASSVLYGSGASTAVINIKTKKGGQKTFNIHVRNILGTARKRGRGDYKMARFSNDISIDGSNERWRYLLSLAQHHEDAFSAISQGDENDPFRKYTAMTKLRYSASKKYEISVGLNYDGFKADYDDGFQFEDADNRLSSKQRRVEMSQRYKHELGILQMNTSYSEVDRKAHADYPAAYRSKSFATDLYNSLYLNDKAKLFFGAQLLSNNMEDRLVDTNKGSAVQFDPYLNFTYRPTEGFTISVGTRLSTHSLYGNYWVYSINPTYKKNTSFGHVRFISSYATSYITPSLYQLYQPFYGNSDLKPEENSTTELGLGLSYKTKVNLSLVYFRREEKNFVDFIDVGGGIYQYFNVDKKFHTKGIELESILHLSERLKLTANAAYTVVDEQLDLRIPKHKVNSTIAYSPSLKTDLSMSFQYNGKRNDIIASTYERIELKAYALFDLYLNRKIVGDKLKLSLSITNLFDQKYEELYGYNSRGRNLSMGFHFAFGGHARNFLLIRR